tara:strand:- start:7864 stop:9039 length:1176 start_codon:yes stop_codon:yes gene_type:complete
MPDPKRNNRKKNTLMSHRKNTTSKRFNSFMNDVYDLLERDRYLNLKTEYVAMIISGQITTDSTENNFDISTGESEEIQQTIYKIRFVEDDEKYNSHEDPSIYAGQDKEKYLISLHPDAFYEFNITNSVVMAPGTIVRVSDRQNKGIYKIEEILAFSGELIGSLFERATAPISSFLNPTAPIGFLKDFLTTPQGEWTKGSGVRFRNAEEEKRATQFLNELTKLAAPHEIQVHVNSAYRSPADQARVVAGNTARENGKNLVVYGDTTKAMYLKYGKDAHANPKGKAMQKLVDYETKKLARAIKRDPNYHGHGTGYAFDLRIRGLNRQKLKLYKDLIESIGAKVLYETHPPHYHVWLKDWTPKEETLTDKAGALADKGLEFMKNLTNSYKEDSE